MITCRLLLWLGTATLLSAQERVTLRTADGAELVGEVYGQGKHGVVLAHGGRFNKESWKPQATQLAAAGFRVLAFDFRGYGQSTGPGAQAPMSAPLWQDVLAAVRYLRKTGAKPVSVVGGSMGGGAALDAVVYGKKGEIDRLIGLGTANGEGPPEQVKVRKLFLIAVEDANADGPRLPGAQEAFRKMPDPKRMVILDGNAHAQFLFASNQGERVMKEILDFLSAP